MGRRKGFRKGLSTKALTQSPAPSWVPQEDQEPQLARPGLPEVPRERSQIDIRRERYLA